nr:putative reverse transcriptase domain-containing protein [Tanacetum cinerariifolium]
MDFWTSKSLCSFVHLRVTDTSLDITEGIENTAKTCGKIRESGLVGSELVQETTDKVALIKEKLKATRIRQKSYVDNMRKHLEWKLVKVMLEVSWKDVVHFGEKEILAPRDVGPFEIIQGIYSTNANLHAHLEECKVDKTLHFVEESVEIINREVKSLKCSRIPIVKSIGTRSEVMRIS